MTLSEKLLKEFEELPEDKKIQVIDFVKFLSTKRQNDMDDLMDAVISENREALEELSK